jgi:hypothetical protein
MDVTGICTVRSVYGCVRIACGFLQAFHFYDAYLPVYRDGC